MIPFTGNPLDRASEKRGDAGWIDAKRRDPSTLILPMWRLQPFIRGPENAAAPLELALMRPGMAEQLAGPDAPFVFLGLEGRNAMFALDVSAAADPATVGPLAGLGHFRDARDAARIMDERDTAILGQAKAMIDWHRRHRFCANCGQPTEVSDAGYKRSCPACKAEHFPRTDPVVIMLVTDGDECLVGRGKMFPPGMFSALAGFIEPGETIEEAVRREIMEETGVKTGEVTYFTTQPWPFPSSLMIGCFAKAESRELVLDPNEIVEARWLKRDMVRQLIGGESVDGIWLPPKIAIAHHLLKAWAQG